MRIDGLFSNTIDLLGKSVDLRSKSQNLIASNIANAETPNFIPKSLDFEQELQGALKERQSGQRSSTVPHPRHIPVRGAAAASGIQSVTGRVIETPAKTPGKDGNAVELENEMGRMAENQVMFNASVQMLNKKFEGLRSAIREGK
ncbi:MAG: flagellar basal body rod protein FlgB [Desulfuromonadaceae bacterium]|nr:flagellar basal body rod protein FlgB [Desulfuromonadaceae bacterium]